MKALDLTRLIYGDVHENTSESFNRIGLIYFSMKNFQKAMEYFNESKLIKELLYSIDTNPHPDLAH